MKSQMKVLSWLAHTASRQPTFNLTHFNMHEPDQWGFNGPSSKPTPLPPVWHMRWCTLSFQDNTLLKVLWNTTSREALVKNVNWLLWVSHSWPYIHSHGRVSDAGMPVCKYHTHSCYRNCFPLEWKTLACLILPDRCNLCSLYMYTDNPAWCAFFIVISRTVLIIYAVWSLCFCPFQILRPIKTFIWLHVRKFTDNL